MCGSGAWTDGGRQRQSCNPGLPYNSMDGRLKIDGAKATTDRGAGLTAIHSALAIVVQAGDARPPRDMKTKIRPSGKMVESAHSPFDEIAKGKEMERERGVGKGNRGEGRRGRGACERNTKRIAREAGNGGGGRRDAMREAIRQRFARTHRRRRLLRVHC